MNGFGNACDGAVSDGERGAALVGEARCQGQPLLDRLYVTSLEMAGCSISVSLLDDELRALWDAPVHTAALRWEERC